MSSNNSNSNSKPSEKAEQDVVRFLDECFRKSESILRHAMIVTDNKKANTVVSLKIALEIALFMDPSYREMVNILEPQIQKSIVNINELPEEEATKEPSNIVAPGPTKSKLILLNWNDR